MDSRAFSPRVWSPFDAHQPQLHQATSFANAHVDRETEGEKEIHSSCVIYAVCSRPRRLLHLFVTKTVHLRLEVTTTLAAWFCGERWSVPSANDTFVGIVYARKCPSASALNYLYIILW